MNYNSVRSQNVTSRTIKPLSMGLLLWIVLLEPSLTLGGEQSIDAKCTGVVFPVKQDKDWACWAASAAMMVGWKNADATTISQVLDKAEGTFRDRYTNDVGLTGDEICDFVKAMDMRAEPLACYTPGGFGTLISDRGPLFVIYNPNGDKTSRVRHVVVVTGCAGDGSIDGTSVIYLDPGDGKEHKDSFKDFMTKYETGEAKDIKLQIAHF